MSFAGEVKQEVAMKVMEGNDARAELSALIQMTSSLSFSSRGITILVTIENAAVARTIYRIIRERYQADVELFVKKKMNLKKNRIYGLRILSKAPYILKDLGIYSSRGLLEKPLAKIVHSDNNARAYLAGAFLAAGSVNPPEKPSYHLEITAANEAHAEFLIRQLARFYIPAKTIERRGKSVVYIKAAEKIADFLRCIDASEALMKYENIRISRDFANNITRLNNMDVANEMKSQKAAVSQLEDIRILEEAGRVPYLDDKLKDVIALRKEFPESSLSELAAVYERRTGITVTKSGMKHRFVRIHELAVKGRKNDPN
ncbi:MAG: DNA-binding protein WhiA [Solobacterium sp.]|nr:DNA-binding protein WhiA [Solobacterium sp.]